MTTPGIVCSEDEYTKFRQSQASGNFSISCLTPGQRIGLALTVEASLLSCVCSMIILTWIGWNVRWYRRALPGGDWKLFEGARDVYMFSLFVFDFLQGMGGVLNIKWAHKGIVTTGHYCTAQGVIQQIGELGVAVITLLLAIHTFVGALWRGLEARRIALGLVCLTCLFITLWVSIGAGIHKDYETPTPYWCWINSEYLGERLGGEYIWLWLALFVSAILYIPLYFWAEGRFSVDTKCWYRFQLFNADQRVEYAKRRAALSMLLYPIAYSIVVLPTTVTRWSSFSGHNVPSAATFFGGVTFDLSGAINVLLFLIIKPQLLLFHRPEELGPEIELAPQGPGPANFLDAANVQHCTEPTAMALADEDPGRHNALSRVNSGRVLDDDHDV